MSQPDRRGRAAKAALVRVLSRDRRIRAAYLFGSLACGRERADSDADVALLLAGRASRAAFKTRLRYAGELEGVLGRRVDVVILNDADPFLRFQIFSKGLLLFAREPREAAVFEAYSLNAWWDYAAIKRDIDQAAAGRMFHGR